MVVTFRTAFIAKRNKAAALQRLCCVYSGCGIVDILMMVMATTRDKMLDDIGKMRQ